MSDKNKLMEIAQSFNTAMLVTQTEDGPRARPMAIGHFHDDGTIYFVTARNSEKVDEIKTDDEVLVTMQGKTQQVSLRGLGEVIDDKARLKRMWKPSWDIWFEGGVDDPEAVMLRVVPTEGEFWDPSGANLLRFAYAAVKAYVTGDAIEGDRTGDHGQAEL